MEIKEEVMKTILDKAQSKKFGLRQSLGIEKSR
jgi:hypothetical protein